MCRQLLANRELREFSYQQKIGPDAVPPLDERHVPFRAPCAPVIAQAIGQVVKQPDPLDASSRHVAVSVRYGLDPGQIGVGYPRKTHSTGGRDTHPGPTTWVDLNQLEFSSSSIPFELKLRDSRIAQLSAQPG